MNGHDIGETTSFLTSCWGTPGFFANSRGNECETWDDERRGRPSHDSGITTFQLPKLKKNETKILQAGHLTCESTSVHSSSPQVFCPIFTVDEAKY